MAVCDNCRHEYLDSFDECPFCARRNDDLAAEEYIDRARTLRISPVVIALLAGVAGAMAILVYLVVVGVISVGSTPKVTAFANRQACYMTEENTEQAARVYAAQIGAPVTDVSVLVGNYLSKTPACPSGGRYTWDASQEHLVCSTHGWHGNPPKQ